jgi:AcrR family transcriptional regulator
MVQTPWGDIEKLGTRKLSPGPSKAPEEVAQNQRKRLLAAMVAACDECGYRETTVATLLHLSGVSRSTFYVHFDDKEDCFVATVKQVLADAVAVVRLVEQRAPKEERAKAMLEGLIQLLAVQPAAARLCLVEPHAAGDRAIEAVRAGIDEIYETGLTVLAQTSDRGRIGEELARAFFGGFYGIVYDRLHHRREEELPELVQPIWDWAMSYPPPPQPLRLRARKPAFPVEQTTAPFAAYSSEQRIIRAFAGVVAEKGYGAATIADICTAASISQGTFYAYFDDKDDALAAALDSSGAQMLAATIPTVRRAADWKHGVRAAAGAVCGFLASEPAFARLRIDAVYSAGPDAIAQRNLAGIELLRAILPVFENVPKIEPITLELILGAINGILQDTVRNAGPSALPEVAPLITYISLAPSLGADEACEIANGDGRRR